MCEFIQKMKDEIGKPKFEYKSFAVNEEIFEEVSNFDSNTGTNAFSAKAPCPTSLLPGPRDVLASPTLYGGKLY